MIEGKTARRSFPAKCKACDRELDMPLFCSSCRTLQSAEGLNFFELLGVPPEYDLDPDLLRSRYFKLMRELHPDRMSGSGSAAQLLSLRINAQINKAYKVLLDPVQRAEYLLELGGGQSAAANKQVPQEVLLDTLELRETIQECQADDDAEKLAEVGRAVAQRHQETVERIAALARELPGTEETRSELRGQLNTIRYYAKMQEQL